MDSKLLASLVVGVVVLLTFFSYYSFVAPSKNSEAVATELPGVVVFNPIDPANKYSDYQAAGGAVVYLIDAQLAGLNSERITLRTSQRIVDIKKPADVRYFAAANAKVDEISGVELRQDEPVRVILTVDAFDNSIRALSVTALR